MARVCAASVIVSSHDSDVATTDHTTGEFIKNSLLRDANDLSAIVRVGRQAAIDNCVQYFSQCWGQRLL